MLQCYGYLALPGARAGEENMDMFFVIDSFCLCEVLVFFQKLSDAIMRAVDMVHIVSQMARDFKAVLDWFAR